MKWILGVDTSCYTTSTALCAADGAEELFFQQRRLLRVPQGERGLMQSAALFQHVCSLPELVQALTAGAPRGEIAAVCASTRPREAEDSYMPVFRAGESFARGAAALLDVPFYAASHQQGHLRAARIGTPLGADRPYLGLHLSGGTTELLQVEGIACRLLGGSLDLHAGQLIDRVGVAMGLPFPAGPSLEKLALCGRARGLLSASLRGVDCHFSGAETKALGLVREAALAPEDLAAEVFDCVARTVTRMLVEAARQTGLREALLGGGVISSGLIREQVEHRVRGRLRELKLYFARPELSGDNAVGAAFIGRDRYLKEERYGCEDH